MKTQKHTNPTLPSPVKFSLYIIAVAAVCFLNWSALKAVDFPKAETQTLEARLEAALVPVVEEEVQLEEWMLTFSKEDQLDELFADIIVFPEEEYYDEELETVLQAWRLDRLSSNLEEVADLEPEIEDWMVNSETWATIEFIATK